MVRLQKFMHHQQCADDALPWEERHAKAVDQPVKHMGPVRADHSCESSSADCIARYVVQRAQRAAEHALWSGKKGSHVSSGSVRDGIDFRFRTDRFESNEIDSIPVLDIICKNWELPFFTYF